MMNYTNNTTIWLFLFQNFAKTQNQMHTHTHARSNACINNILWQIDFTTLDSTFIRPSIPLHTMCNVRRLLLSDSDLTSIVFLVRIVIVLALSLSLSQLVVAVLLLIPITKHQHQFWCRYFIHFFIVFRIFFCLFCLIFTLATFC